MSCKYSWNWLWSLKLEALQPLISFPVFLSWICVFPGVKVDAWNVPNANIFRFLFMCFTSGGAAKVFNSEQCQNYPRNILWEQLFRDCIFPLVLFRKKMDHCSGSFEKSLTQSANKSNCYNPSSHQQFGLQNWSYLILIQDLLLLALPCLGTSRPKK